MLASATAAGGSFLTATGALNGSLQSSAVSQGRSRLTVNAMGRKSGSATAIGSSALTALASSKFTRGCVAVGRSIVMVTYAPDLFGPPDEPSYDPSATPALTSGPPIRIGMTLRGSMAVVPPIAGI